MSSEKLSSLTAVILAGGLGTRLRAEVADRPKVLAEVNSRSFLRYLLDQLSSNGCKNIVLCTGYLGEQIESEFGDKYNGLRISYSKEESLLGTGGALKKAQPLINSDPVLVMNGDSFCNADLMQFYQFHLAKQALATILLTKVSDTSRFGRVEVGNGHRIISFREKQVNQGVGFINAGVYLLSPGVFAKIPDDKIVSLEKEIFPTLIGQAFYGFTKGHRFIDIGTPDSYRAAEDFFKIDI